MFKKLLLKAIKGLSPEEKVEFRKMLESENIEETNNVTDESIDESKVDNKNGNEKVDDTTKTDTASPKDKEPNPQENADESSNEPLTDENPVDETGNGGEEPSVNDNGEMPPVEPQQPQVSTVEESGNAVRVDDLVTKEELADKLAAFTAKYDAIVKENEDLKNKVGDLQKKYEEPDFGNYQRKGVETATDKVPHQSFEEYSKNFM
jgi:hypothetical protein